MGRNRLTKKHIHKEHLHKYYTKKNEYDYGELVHKLGQLEDIEEMLGIDLITLFKALKNGIYSNFYPINEILKYEYDRLTLEAYKGCLIAERKDGKNISVSLDDYGKTWALTREELEK